MKNLMLIIALLTGMIISSHAQGLGKASEALKLEMKKLSYLAGHWKGEAIAKQRSGPDTKIMQEENIQFKLDNTLLLIEGTGRSSESNEIVFNALAVVTYDEATKQFKFRSHLKDGSQTDAYFKVLGENHFEWGFDIQNNAKMRYDMLLNPKDKSWYEIGEYSPDSITWHKFIELKLTKLD